VLKRVSAFLSIIILIGCFSITIHATQVHTYAIAYRNQTTNNTGFCAGATLPTLGSNWSSGIENKINFETWFNINNSSSQWVEMGYHNGYAWNPDGSPNTSVRYIGLFVSRMGSSWNCQAIPAASWDSGESHIWKIQLRQDWLGIWYADMYADNVVVKSYSFSGPSSTGSTDAGLEFGNSNNAWQGISLPSNMWGVGSRIDSTWTGWYALGNVQTYDDIGNVVVSYNSGTNQINFN